MPKHSPNEKIFEKILDMRKNIWKFVVREFLKSLQDATNINIKVKFKILGRRTVASTEDLSRHRFGDSRGDRPSFFNFNLFVMRESKGHGSTASVRESIPTQLAKALRLIGEARGIICHIDEANPHLKDDIYETVFKTDQLLVESAFGISDMLGVAYREEHFFGKEVAL